MHVFSVLSISIILCQECLIEMNVGMGDQNTTVLLPFEKTLQQSKDMTQFSITDFELVNVTHPKTGIELKIKMKRKIMSEMMTTYFPSALLLMITYATTFFKPFFFEAALSVNLTTMLVMTTIFISKMEGLPPTSTTKMIDYWLILCQLVPFVRVVLLTAVEYLREEKEEMDKVDCPKLEDAIISHDMQNEEEQGTETKEAWNIPQEKRSKVPMLMIIGKFEFSLLS